MCIYCRTRGDKAFLHKKHIRHSKVTQTDSMSSFSSLDSQDQPQLCSRHKHRIVHNVYYPAPAKDPYLVSDNNAYGTTMVRSPGKFQKVATQMPTEAETNYDTKSQMAQLRRELLYRDKKIEDLGLQNQRLLFQMNSVKEQHLQYISDLAEEFRSRVRQENIEVSRQDKKIELLVSEFGKLKNRNSQKLTEVAEDLLRMRSTSNFKTKKSPRPQLVKKVVVQEENCPKWKDNFIAAFNDMVSKLSRRQVPSSSTRNSPKRRTKQSWRYLKSFFKQSDK